MFKAFQPLPKSLIFDFLNADSEFFKIPQNRPLERLLRRANIYVSEILAFQFMNFSL